MTTITMRSPAMRAISQIMVVSMLFSTTVTATWGIRGMPLPQAVTALASEAPIDWLAATTLPALPEVDSGGGGTLLQLNADLLASDGLAVPTVQPRLVAPAFLKGPSLDYIVASAPSMAGETSYLTRFDSPRQLGQRRNAVSSAPTSRAGASLQRSVF